jgi:hypothetical protein
MRLHTLYDVAVLVMLAYLIVRQEMIRMTTAAQLTDLNDTTTALETAETKLAADESVEIKYLQTVQAELAAAGSTIDLQPIIDREKALLAKLTTDDAGLTAAVPAAPAPVVAAPVAETPVPPTTEAPAPEPPAVG